MLLRDLYRRDALSDISSLPRKIPESKSSSSHHPRVYYRYEKDPDGDGQDQTQQT